MLVVAYTLLFRQHSLNLTPMQRHYWDNMPDGESGVDCVLRLESRVSNEEESPLLSFIGPISSLHSFLITQSLL